MSQPTIELEPITKSVVVPLKPKDAFELFTARVASWWPLGGRHSLFDDAKTAVVEGGVGGRVYEISADGEEGLWGTIKVWEPPHRLVSTWHPGRSEETAQEIEIVFVPDGDGTRVELEHRGWERAPEKRAGYDEGWDGVLGRYAEAAAA
jgi:uncharacterized protein YndB with AHSA1/START domain